MGQYSIKDVEQLTGVKAHTLRIWEQRYNAIQPHRTDTNIRFYDDDQLKFLINVSLLMKHGRKVSRVFKMSPDEMSQELKLLIKASSEKGEYTSLQADALVLAMLELDEDRFEKIISNVTLRYGFETCMIQVVIPFLSKVGILWATSEINVAQEHFISNLVRRKLIVAIDAQTNNDESDQRFLLFLPEGELHEIGLLFAKYLIKSRGHKTIYLGQSVPLADLGKLNNLYRCNYLVTYFTVGYDREQMYTYLAGLKQHFASQTILVCGPLAREIDPNEMPNVRVMLEVEDMVEFLRGLASESF